MLVHAARIIQVLSWPMAKITFRIVRLYSNQSVSVRVRYYWKLASVLAEEITGKTNILFVYIYCVYILNMSSYESYELLNESSWRNLDKDSDERWKQSYDDHNLIFPFVVQFEEWFSCILIWPQFDVMNEGLFLMRLPLWRHVIALIDCLGSISKFYFKILFPNKFS